MKYNIAAFSMVATDIQTVAKKVSDFLKEKGHKCALIGGMAVGSYARPRSTADVDLLVPDEAKDAIEELGEMRPLALHAGYSGVTVTVDDIPVDFIFLGDLPAEVLNGPVVGGVRVVAPEALILLKLHTGRLKDISDVAEIVKAGMIDLKKVRKFLKKIDDNVLDDFDSAVMLAEHEVRFGSSKSLVIEYIAKKISRS
jgi:hypothetical protein